MEVLLVGSRHNLTKLANEDLSFTIRLETVQPSDVVRDLGVWLDSELSLRQHVSLKLPLVASTNCDDSVWYADVRDVKSLPAGTCTSHLEVRLL